MREIKFRAWVKDLRLKTKGTMDYNVSPCEACSECHYDKYELQQFTGLKDKNGVEIYEGDILKENGFICEVRFRDGYFYNQFKEHTTYIWESKSNYKTIIGNIYENPELIK